MKKVREKVTLTYDIFSKYRTILMGIAILSILIFHFTEDCKVYHYNFQGGISLFYKYISSTGVDIFLFLSGFGLYYAWKKNPIYKEFILKRLKKVLIPYLLISIPAYIIKNIFIKDLGALSVLKGISFYSFLTNGDKWYWYILMIIICYFIYPWIFEIVEENKTKIKSQTTMIGVFTFISVIAIMLQKYDAPLFKILNIMLLRFPIFVFGSFIGRASYEKRVIGKEWIVLGIISLVCIPLRETNQIIFVRYVLGALNLFIFFIIVQVIEYLNRRDIKLAFIKKVLEWFGNYSLELYLVHVTVRSIMNDLGYCTCRIRYYLLMLLISIILAIVVKKITKFLIKLLELKKKDAIVQE